MSIPNTFAMQQLTPERFREISFTALYMHLQGLRASLAEAPSLADIRTVKALESVLGDARHAQESLASFMYKLAAECLIEILAASPQAPLGKLAEKVLRRCSAGSSGDTCLASSQALGSLPVRLAPPPEPLAPAGEALPQISCNDLFRRASIVPNGLHLAGRNLIIPKNDPGRILVLKLSGSVDGGLSLYREASWMRLVQKECQDISERFEVPDVLPVSGSEVFILKGLRNYAALPRKLAQHEMLLALAFETTPDYFAYPNDPQRLRTSGAEDLLELMGRNSRLFGRLAGRGILHTAPIPLFHNRTQQTRRDDQGVYLWLRGGRLDRWLWSCRYPNFGLSGLRDFEHFRSFNGSRGELFREAGNQILSLALVAGSCFRFLEPNSYGLDDQGHPLDLRHLFDAQLLTDLLRTIACGFFEGFVGRTLETELMPSCSRLAGRMIDEMGVDRSMFEVLRLEDQAAMEGNEFLDFLQQRGFSSVEAAGLKKGEKELQLRTGPHLGGFNQRISLPELIDFTAGTAATAIAGKFLDQCSPFSVAAS